MLLADLGAEVLRIDREEGNGWPNPILDRGRSIIGLDIRSEEGRNFCLDATDHADVVIEGFRPGVMERIGLGPDILCSRNPRLIYGRMTGWGQTGPWARLAGHDINYIAITGALAAIGAPGAPAIPPLNLVGDFGGGSMFLAFGIMAALWERERSGKGQVIDAAIVDGVSSLMAAFVGLLPTKRISMDRGTNVFGGAAPFYRCYLCSDGTEIAVGALEPHFYRELIERTGAPKDLLDRQDDSAFWAEDSARLQALFLTKTADQWCGILAGSDACFAPVLPLEQVTRHPHLAARETYVVKDGLAQVAPTPRFSRTPGRIRSSCKQGELILERWKEASL
jgi:alpha-methylacyl-CoA racemase